MENVRLHFIRLADGPDVSKQMVDSVKELGVLSPVLLRLDEKNGWYRVVDGNRRVMAARLAKLDSIPAIVLDGLDEDAEKRVTLLSNHMRSENPYHEIRAYMDLTADDKNSNRDIRDKTGIGRASIDRLDRIVHSHFSLVEGFFNRKIALSVMDAAAKLPMDKQLELVSILNVKGKLVKSDVDAVKAGEPEPEAPEPTMEEKRKAAMAMMKLSIREAADLEIELGEKPEHIKEFYKSIVGDMVNAAVVAGKGDPELSEVPF